MSSAVWYLLLRLWSSETALCVCVVNRTMRVCLFRLVEGFVLGLWLSLGFFIYIWWGCCPSVAVFIFFLPLLFHSFSLFLKPKICLTFSLSSILYFPSLVLSLRLSLSLYFPMVRSVWVPPPLLHCALWLLSVVPRMGLTSSAPAVSFPSSSQPHAGPTSRSWRSWTKTSAGEPWHQTPESALRDWLLAKLDVASLSN